MNLEISCSAFLRYLQVQEFLEDEDLAMYTNSLGLPVAQGSTSEI